MPDIRAKATIQIVVEVDTGAYTDYHCTLGQVFNQAGSEGIRRIKQLCEQAGGMRVIGDPIKVSVVTIEEK